MVAWKTDTDFNEMHTVLIISQDPDMIAIWETLFKQKNCFVVSENSPREAIQSGRLLAPSLIVIDLDLSPQERLDLCRELRATTSGTLLLLAPSASNENVFEYYHAGVDEHIPTPISPMALLVKSMAWLVKQETVSSGRYLG